jgi:hypothetical protein
MNDLSEIVERLRNIEATLGEIKEIKGRLGNMEKRLDSLAAAPPPLTRRQRAAQAFPRGSRQSSKMVSENSITGPLGRSRFTP